MGAYSSIARPLNEGMTFGTSPQEVQSRMNLQQMAGQQQIQKQVIAENALKLQAQQEDQTDQQTIQQAFQNNITPDGQVDFDKVRAAVQPKIRLRNLQGLEDMHNKLLQGTLQMDKAKRDQLLAKNTTIGNELMGILQTPVDQRPAAYAGTRARLIQLGDIDPNDPQYPENPPLDDQTIKGHLAQVGYAASVQKLADQQAQEDQRKAAAARSTALAAKTDAEADAKTIQQGIEDAARDHLAVTNQKEHSDWWGTLPSDVQKRMPKVFNPDTTPGIIQNMALTAEQRQQNATKKSQAEAEARKALVAGGETGLAFLAHDPTVSQETRDAAAAAQKDVTASKAKTTGGLTANEQREQTEKAKADLEKERNRFQDVRQKEVAKWSESQQLTAALQPVIANGGAKPTDPITDPLSGKPSTVAQLQAKLDSTNALATEYNSQGKEILRQNKWGDFAPGKQPAQQSVTPPAAQPGAPPAAATPAAPKATTATAKPPVTPNFKLKTTGKMTLRTDIPARIADGIQEGETKPVNTPKGTISLKKSGGKLYQVD